MHSFNHLVTNASHVNNGSESKSEEPNGSSLFYFYIPIIVLEVIANYSFAEINDRFVEEILWSRFFFVLLHRQTEALVFSYIRLGYC